MWQVTDNPPPKVFKAIECFKEIWRNLSFNPMPEVGKFEGNIHDLEALEFAEYEIGFPNNNYEYASLIWAQVIVNSSCLSWGIDDDNEIVIASKEDSYPRFVFYPHTRMKEVFGSSYSQFDSTTVLTELFLIQVLAAGYNAADFQKIIEMTRKLKSCENYSCLPVVRTLTNLIERKTKP